MASVQINKKYENKSASDIYKASIAAIPNAGFNIWKRRDIAQLVLGKGEVDSQEIRCNIAVSMVDNSVTISVEADAVADNALNGAAEKLAAELGKLLG